LPASPGFVFSLTNHNLRIPSLGQSQAPDILYDMFILVRMDTATEGFNIAICNIAIRASGICSYGNITILQYGKTKVFNKPKHSEEPLEGLKVDFTGLVA